MKSLAKFQYVRQIKSVLFWLKEGWVEGLETCPLVFLLPR